MRQPIWHLTEIIRQVLRVDKDIALQEVYAEIRDRIPLNREQRETTYGAPNFQHSIRSTLSRLVKNGEAIRVKRGIYRKTPDLSSRSIRK